MSMALCLLLNALSFFTFLPLWKKGHWTIRIWDYPRKQLLFVQITILSVVLFSVNNSSFYQSTSIICSIFSVAYLSYRIYPYTKFASYQIVSSVEEDDSISILVANVEMKNTQYEKLIEVIKKQNADILLLLETNRAWQKNLQPIEKQYPYLHHLPLENTYGMLIYSKQKLYDANFHYLVNNSIPSFKAKIKTEDNRFIHFYGVHPEPPFPSQSKTTDERDAEILTIGKNVYNQHDPVIVAGDLNDVAWSFTTKLFQKQSGLLDPRMGRGFFSTFHARKIWARWPLDHIFVSKHFELIRIKRLEYVGSDHFPIYIELRINALNENESLEKLNHSEKETVEDKIKRA